MKVVDSSGNDIELNTGFQYGEDFLKLLNFITPPVSTYLVRDDLEGQCENFYLDIMNYERLDTHNHLMESGRYDLAARELNTTHAESLDHLTGLYSKKFIDKKLISLVSDIYNGGVGDFSLIMCDLDKFKLVNDEFSHAVGDDTLALFGKLILGCLRPSDIGYRFGGEEFSILLPDTDLADAACVAERIRKTIDDRLCIGSFGLNQTTAHSISKSDVKKSLESCLEADTFILSKNLTCSFGVSNYLVCDSSTSNLFDVADKALYKAKNNGRNRVEF